MKTLDLARELDYAIAAMAEEHRQQLVALGVPSGLLATPLPMVGVGNIRVAGDTYEPEPDGYGGTAFITPVLVGDPQIPEAADPDSTVRFAGDLVDLVAWRPTASTPGRRASAPPSGLAPSRHNGSRPHQSRCGVTRWAGCEPGAADWSYSRPSAPHNGPSNNSCRGGFLAEDEAHARELRRILARPWPAPEVWARPKQRRSMPYDDLAGADPSPLR